MEIDELTKWILCVNRRLLVMKEIHENELIKGSGLHKIRCITLLLLCAAI